MPVVPSDVGHFIPQSGAGLLKPLAMLGAAGLGVSLAGQAWSNTQVQRSFQTMLQRYPELQRENPTRVKQLFETISRAAPDVAQDPMVAGSLIKRMLNYDGIDHATYMELVSTQEKMTKNRMSQITPFTSLAGPAIEFARHW
jgi:hypothetical protein